MSRKHVVITGASSGIGEAVARELGQGDAYALTLVARRRDLLDKLVAEIGPHVRAVSCDLADVAHCSDWLPAAEEAFGPVEILINNAGMENTGPSLNSDADVCTKLFNLNLITPIMLVRLLAPRMVTRGDGVIVNVASVAALVAPPMQAYYGASKAGLAAFSETLRGELADTGVHIVTVYPGPVATAMAEKALIAFGGREVMGPMPEGTAPVLALRIRRAIEARHTRVIYPRFYAVTRWFPWLARVMVDNFGPKPKYDDLKKR